MAKRQFADFDTVNCRFVQSGVSYADAHGSIVIWDDSAQFGNNKPTGNRHFC